jgi:DNA-binding winged helix-turn-helix (wHTH) protein
MMKQELTFRFGEAVFDPGRGTLHCGGEMVMLRAKTFSLLAYLVRNGGRVIGKDELFEAVWPDSTVTEDSLTQCIRDARKAIGDTEKSIIRTMPRRGYMIVPAVPRALPPSEAVVKFGGAQLSQCGTSAMVRHAAAVMPSSTPVDLANEALVDAAADYLAEVEVSGDDPLFNVAVALTDVRASGRRLQFLQPVQPASRTSRKLAQIQSRQRWPGFGRIS